MGTNVGGAASGARVGRSTAGRWAWRVATVMRSSNVRRPRPFGRFQRPLLVVFFVAATLVAVGAAFTMLVTGTAVDDI